MAGGAALGGLKIEAVKTRRLTVIRSTMRCVVFALVSAALVGLFSASAQVPPSAAAAGVNLALVAEASTSVVSDGDRYA